MSIEFEIDKAELISINDQYIHPVRKTKSGKYISYFASSPKLKKIKEFYNLELPKVIPQSSVIGLKNALKDKYYNGLELHIKVGVPDSDWKCVDISNFIKSLEDRISEYLNIDDSYNFRVIAEKLHYNSPYYKIIVKISVISSSSID